MNEVVRLSKIVCTQANVGTMLKDPQTPRYAVRRTQRTYTPQFKAELVAACRQPGASIAAVALQHGMNTNVLHRWLKEWAQGLHRLEVGVSTTVVASQPPAFIPIDLSAVSPASAGELPSASLPTPADDIRIECQRTGMFVTVHWPLSAATQCAQMLRELLR